MKTMTTILTLAATLVSAGVGSLTAQADELLTRQQVFVPDSMYRQWINERNGHDGVLVVHGALLSSPCTLQSNEVALPLATVMQADGPRTPLSLVLTGCGYGDPLTSKATPAGQTSVVMTYSALLTGPVGGVLQPGQRMTAEARTVLHGGSTRLTWYLSDVQRQLLTPAQPRVTPDTMLRLRLDYE